MELTFWGVRGSFPVCGEKFLKYGGHTPCASVFSSENKMIIVDAGTGIKKLGDRLIKDDRKERLHIHLLFTHFHMDHILGLVFFSPLFSDKVTLTFYSPLNQERTVGLLNTLMGGRFFPVDFSETASEKIFKKVPSKDFSIEDIRISPIPLNHPQGALGYRFEENGQSIVFATDTEHPEHGFDEQLVCLARRTDVLIYDSTFTPEEYNQGKKGWGHSTWLKGTQIAEHAEVKNLCLSHFNPSHSDEEIDRAIIKAREHFSKTHAAREGQTIPIKRK
ncbi:MAG: hypothetical protein GF421_11115 [Candidatus Aminicenantes bacterium]|nr:hypothetical protein [Candidatus Aminicenantes bacterium]